MALWHNKREFQIQTELIPQSANLLIASNLKSPIFVENENAFIPKQDIMQRILAEDEGKIGVALSDNEQ